ncbi:MAG: DUF1990 domain-containing protein [Myxococcota bacterium]
MNGTSPAQTLTSPTFRLFRPTDQTMRALASSDEGADFSYPDVGSTREGGPEGWATDEQEAVVGSGKEDFERVKEAIRAWTMFDLPWVHLVDPDGPPEPEKMVTFSSHQLGLWIVNSCRVVYMVDDVDPAEERFGFAYGTLPGHAVAGEELFLARWDRSTDEVWFGLQKFSRPRHFLVRMAGPVGRAIQRRFSRDAIERIRLAVQSRS